MRVSVHENGEQDTIGNYNLPPEEAARKYVEEYLEDTFSAVLVVTPIDKEARDLPGWRRDERDPSFRLFHVEPKVSCSVTEQPAGDAAAEEPSVDPGTHVPPTAEELARLPVISVGT